MNSINHVAIIMDGNGRWGLKNKNNRNSGHKEGLKVVEKIINTCVNKRIKFLTLYAFSTENWKRPKKRDRISF
ncbi:undecaprenyl diphosphate synthase family protein [Candidatus Pelagibacter sp.]|nr:undecaprenyl diphosphate synthase family protein [Candidatus Pelagibacter sp.]